MGNEGQKPDLFQIFQQINEIHFDGFLEAPELRFNSRLRTSAGRFIPGHRKLFSEKPPLIEVALYLLEESQCLEHLRDTMAHEMIHYWLWVRKRPHGHTVEFLEKMKQMGVSRYNPVPRPRPFKYIYVCIACEKEFFARRRLGPLACAVCCKRFNGGRYNFDYRLVLVKTLNRAEGLELVDKSPRRSI